MNGTTNGTSVRRFSILVALLIAAGAGSEVLLTSELRSGGSERMVVAIHATDNDLYLITQEPFSFRSIGEARFTLESRPIDAPETISWSKNLNELYGVSEAIEHPKAGGSLSPWKMAHKDNHLILLFNRSDLNTSQREPNLMYKLDDKGNSVSYGEVGLPNRWFTSPEQQHSSIVSAHEILVGSEFLIVPYPSGISILRDENIDNVKNWFVSKRGVVLGSTISDEELIIVGGYPFLEKEYGMKVWVKKYSLEPPFSLIAETHTDMVSNAFAMGNFDLLLRKDALIMVGTTYTWGVRVCEFSRESLELISCAEIEMPPEYSEKGASWTIGHPNIVKIPNGYTWTLNLSYEDEATKVFRSKTLVATRSAGEMVLQELDEVLGLDAHSSSKGMDLFTANESTLFVMVSVATELEGQIQGAQELHAVSRQTLGIPQQTPVPIKTPESPGR